MILGFWKSLAGTYTVKITSAAPMDTLDAINKSGLSLSNITYVNDLCIRGEVYVSNINTLRKCVEQRNEELTVLEKNGIYWSAVRLLKRPVLIIGILLYTFLSLFLPTRILFIQVDGNTTIPDRMILEKAEGCGIVFGASRREIRSEKTKNALLSAIPQLQWAGVNTAGCIAVISVRERSTADTTEDVHNISSIVATRDGIIHEMTVTRGTAVCQVGQAVKKGQLLVSGYTDCGIFVKAEQAQAEIIAQTQRTLHCCTPSNFVKRGEIKKTQTSYAIKFGKSIINLWKNSGIIDTECVKMYDEQPLLLPGGFALPVTFIRESCVFYDHSLVQSEKTDDFGWMESTAKVYLERQIPGGSVLKSAISTILDEDVYNLYGFFSCKEMIGQIRSEEFVKYDGENN